MHTDIMPAFADDTVHEDEIPIGATCTHCMADVPAALIVAGAQQFCCAGCQTAYTILHQHGLDRYYEFPDRVAKPIQTNGRTFAEFDHPSFDERYVKQLDGGYARTEFYLEGVHCASCVWLVERVPLLVNGVARVDLDIRRSRATVEWHRESTKLSTIARTLQQLGYTPHPFRGVSKDAMRVREDRAMLVRIGVAGAIAINIMLAALALYSGEANRMDASMTQFFRWISLMLIIPAFVWPGRVFFTGALAALRTRALHMDLPIAIALSVGLLRGATNTILSTGPVYFDGLAILIFALLVGRFLQQRGQRLATDSSDALQAVSPASARVVELVNGEQVVRELPIEALLPGMLVDVRAGETIPADGIITEGRSSINAALLTGESRPVSMDAGDSVFAGTLNIGSPLTIRVERAGEDARIAQLFQQGETSAKRRAPIVMLANRLSGVFVAVVVIAAILTFVIKTQLGTPHALDDAIALLIVTCPCALALATPLTITVAVGRAAKRGILIKGADALELLAKPGTMILDKTGTITEGNTALIAWSGPEWVKPLVLALEAGSSHPLADGFRRAWSDVVPGVVTESEHITGNGIAGVVDGQSLVIGSPKFVRSRIGAPLVEFDAPVAEFQEALTPVHVAVDGAMVAVAGLGDRVRDDVATSLASLRAAGWRTVLLSGDSTPVARSVGRSLGFTEDAIISEASPEQKLAFVEQQRLLGRVVMVGDGVNDAAGIAAAHVGIGVHGGAEACLAIADVYLSRAGLAPVVELVNGAQRTVNVIRRNIAFSVAYNLLGASLAIAGVLTPLIAAVLMPISSLTVVFGAWRGFTFARSRT
ncbi:MAG: heavy metal translocating P-type ATPase [Gemmatimonadaceae bacterium]